MPSASASAGHWSFWRRLKAISWMGRCLTARVSGKPCAFLPVRMKRTMLLPVHFLSNWMPTWKQAHGFPETRAVKHLPIQDIAFKRLQKLQCPADADAEGIYATFKAFEVAAFKNTDQGFFASFLKLVTDYTLFLIGFQTVRGKLQALDAVHQLIVDAPGDSFT